MLQQTIPLLRLQYELLRPSITLKPLGTRLVGEGTQSGSPNNGNLESSKAYAT